MFGALFVKECRQVLRSLVYYLYVAVFALFIYSQMGSEGLDVKEPVPGQSGYGQIVTHDETLIMEGVLEKLAWDVYYNSFTTYPIGFYKEVQLTASEREQAGEILERCTGKGYEELMEEMIGYFSQYEQDPMGDAGEAYESYKVTVKEGFTYEEFGAAMEEVCRLVGKGSSYEKNTYENSIRVPMTYEQAKEEYDALCEKDRLTRGYMRLFCDYAGIVLAVLPVFVGVSGALRDKRAKAQQVLFAKPASGGLIVISRYLANLVMLFLPVIAAAFWLQLSCLDRAQSLGIQADRWAFLTVPGMWLLPEVMVVLALAFLITEFTDTILSVFVQVAWGIGSLFGASVLVGDFGLRLVARWNTLGETTLYISQEQEFLRNRGYYFLLAIVCLILTVVVYERKRRKGETFYGKIRNAGR